MEKVDEFQISYQVIRSHRKTLAIQITDGKVIAKAPMTMSRQEIEGFIWEKKNWIEKHLAKAAEEKVDKTYKDGEIITIYGEAYTLSLSELSSRRQDSIALVDNKLCITACQITQELIRELLAIWCKKAGAYYFMLSIRKFSVNMHVIFGRVSVKDQKTRWGSCSSKNNLNFNWRLLLMPPEILDYVVVHELAHLIEMNHSEEFWEIVKKQLPDYLERRDWLLSHGNEYMSY